MTHTFDPGEMSPFRVYGVDLLADENERIWTAEGKLLGYLSSRGAQYAWGAERAGTDEPFTMVDDSFAEPFATGGGTWDAASPPEDEDPAILALMLAHDMDPRR